MAAFDGVCDDHMTSAELQGDSILDSNDTNDLLDMELPQVRSYHCLTHSMSSETGNPYPTLNKIYFGLILRK